MPSLEEMQTYLNNAARTFDELCNDLQNGLVESPNEDSSPLQVALFNLATIANISRYQAVMMIVDQDVADAEEAEQELQIGPHTFIGKGKKDK
jgi:hypothetical protein